MSNSGLSVKNEELREVAFGNINATYTALGPPLIHDSFRVSIHNSTDVDIYISVDGETDHYRLYTLSGRVLDDKTNDMYREAGTQYSIKYDSAPSSGNVWIEVEYT